MSPDELKEAAIELFGSYGWRRKLHEWLEVDVATVGRWRSGEVAVPGPVRRAIEEALVNKRARRTAPTRKAIVA